MMMIGCAAVPIHEDLGAPLDHEEPEGRLLAEDHRARLDREGRGRHDLDPATEQVVVRARPGRCSIVMSPWTITTGLP